MCVCAFLFLIEGFWSPLKIKRFGLCKSNMVPFSSFFFFFVLVSFYSTLVWFCLVSLVSKFHNAKQSLELSGVQSLVHLVQASKATFNDCHNSGIRKMEPVFFFFCAVL